MNSNMRRDELIQRYELAKTQLPDGLPDAPSAAMRERIMKAARDQASAIKTIAPHAASMPASGLKVLENTAASPIATKEAANDSFWNIRALGSLAAIGLVGMLWWQFEHGTPEEQRAAESALPLSPAAITAPTPTPASETASAPENSAKSEAARPAASGALAGGATTTSNAEKQVAAADAATTTKAIAKKQSNTSLDPNAVIPEQSPAPAAFKDAPQSARAPMQAAAPVAALSLPAANPQAPPAAAPMARAMPQTEKSLSDAAAVATSPNDAAQATARVAAAPRAPVAAPAGRAYIASPDKLFQAVEAKNAAMLRDSLAQGASPNANPSARTPEGQPALTQAVIQRWSEGVRILLAAGADKQAKNSKGHTAADVAFELGYRDITDLLATNR